MDSKIKSYVEKFKQMKHKEKFLIFACIFGVVLILLSEIKPPATASKQSAQADYQQYISTLEDKTESIISSIDGVGTVSYTHLTLPTT